MQFTSFAERYQIGHNHGFLQEAYNLFPSTMPVQTYHCTTWKPTRIVEENLQTPPPNATKTEASEKTELRLLRNTVTKSEEPCKAEKALAVKFQVEIKQRLNKIYAALLSVPHILLFAASLESLSCQMRSSVA